MHPLADDLPVLPVSRMMVRGRVTGEVSRVFKAGINSL